MATQVNAVSLYGGDGAGGVDGGVSLNKNHPGHIAGFQMRVIRARCCGAALSRDKSITLELGGELLHRGSLKTGKHERRFDGLQRGTGGQSDPLRSKIVRGIWRSFIYGWRRRKKLLNGVLP